MPAVFRFPKVQTLTWGLKSRVVSRSVDEMITAAITCWHAEHPQLEQLLMQRVKSLSGQLG